MMSGRDDRMGVWKLLFLMVITLVGYGCEFGFDETKSMQKAEQYQQNFQHNAAIIELKKVIKNNASNKQARVMLAKSYLESAQGASAEKELRYARKLGVPEQDLAEPLGKALMQQQKYNEIFTAIPLSISNDPLLKSKLMMTHGYANLSLNNKAAAKSLFTQVKEQGHLTAQADVALAKLAMGEDNNALANQYLDAAISRDNNDIDALLTKGQVLMAKQDVAGARNLFEKVIDIAEQKKSPSNEFQARMHLVQLALLEKNNALAKQKVDLMYKAFPNHPLSNYLYGFVAFQLKDYDGARDKLEKVLAVMPNDLKSKLLLGAVYYALGSYEQANNQISYIVEKVPANVHARKMLAAIQMKQGRGGDAYKSLKSALNNNVNDADVLAMVAQAALNDNRPEEAIDYLKRAQSAKPDNVEISTELAKAYMKTGSFDDAIDELKKVTGKDKKQTKNILIYAYLQKGDIKSARMEVAQLIKDSSGSPVSYTLSGAVELVAGNREMAKKNFGKALEKQQDFVPALLSLAKIAYEDGDVGKAEDYFNKILQTDALNEKATMGLVAIAESRGDMDKAATILEQALAKNPKVVSHAIVLGRYYLKKNQNDKALMVMENLVKQHPDNPNVHSMYAQTQLSAGKPQDALITATSITKRWSDLPIGYIEQARVQNALNQNNQAEISLNNALKINPDLVDAQAGLISIYMKTGQVQKALAVSQDIQKQHPKLATGYLLAGDIHMASKAYPLAQQNYLLAIGKQNPVAAVNKLSTAYERDGKTDKAINTLTKWLKDNPKDLKSRMQLAIIYNQTNKLSEAKTEYLTILKKEPDNVGVLNNLAILMTATDIKQALVYAERAYKLKPGVPAIDDTYGWILYNSGQYAKALPLLKSAAANSNPSIQYHYACVLNKTGDSTQARRILQDIVQQQFDELPAAKKLLKSL